MNHIQISRLGGLTSAHNKSDSERFLLAKSGGDAVLEKHGRAYYSRMAIRRWEAVRAANAAHEKGGGAMTRRRKSA